MRTFFPKESHNIIRLTQIFKGKAAVFYAKMFDILPATSLNLVSSTCTSFSNFVSWLACCYFYFNIRPHGQRLSLNYSLILSAHMLDRGRFTFRIYETLCDRFEGVPGFKGYHFLLKVIYFRPLLRKVHNFCVIPT